MEWRGRYKNTARKIAYVVGTLRIPISKVYNFSRVPWIALVKKIPVSFFYFLSFALQSDRRVIPDVKYSLYARIFQVDHTFSI